MIFFLDRKEIDDVIECDLYAFVVDVELNTIVSWLRVLTEGNK